MIKLNVTVNGGKLPVDIRVYIDNLNNSEDIGYTSPSSFERDHDLPPGKYCLVVGGQNPQNGSTRISLTGQFKLGPAPASPVTRTTTIYSVAFFFTI
jgi:hypothetical protein